MNWKYLCRTAFMLSIVVGVSGCEIFSDSPEPEAIESVVQQAVDNQVYVKGGSFELGDIGDESGRPYVTLASHSRPAVTVTLDSYSISRYETTWGEFRVYLEDAGHLDPYTEKVSTSKYIQSSDDPLSPHYHRKPARSPNYVEAEGFCQWLAEKSGLPFALPTEAQWEYAARSRGRPVPYATNTGKEDNDEYLQRPKEHIDPSIPPSGNMLSHSSLVMERRPVGSYPPNSLGLYDMTGNVSEWTQDWFQEDYYQHAPHRNPAGPASPVDPNDPRKTVRDWAGRGDHFGGGGTVFARSGRPLDAPGNGFRCVVNSPEPIN
jgi:formylglycine-generating enzyme required for sulfatase activity